MLGKRIAALRKREGLSQYELAERLNFSRGKLSNYEQGSRQPDYETLQQIANFFDVSTDYLLGRTDDPTPKKEKNSEEILTDPNLGLWFKEIKNAPEDKQKELQKIWDIIKVKEPDRKSGDKQGE